jgi:hypothetical protein
MWCFFWKNCFLRYINRCSLFGKSQFCLLSVIAFLLLILLQLLIMPMLLPLCSIVSCDNLSTTVLDLLIESEVGAADGLKTSQKLLGTMHKKKSEIEELQNSSAVFKKILSWISAHKVDINNFPSFHILPTTTLEELQSKDALLKRYLEENLGKGITDYSVRFFFLDTHVYTVKTVQFFITRNSQLFDILVMDAIYAKQGTKEIDQFHQKVSFCLISM